MRRTFMMIGVVLMMAGFGHGKEACAGDAFAKDNAGNEKTRNTCTSAGWWTVCTEPAAPKRCAIA